MPKKYFLITALLIGAFIGVHVTSAAVSFGGFTFDQTVTTSKGTPYFVDLIHMSSEELTTGKYNLVSKIGFYGTTDPEDDDYFNDEIFEMTEVRFKLKGANSYIGKSVYTSTTWSNIPGQPGRMVYDTVESIAGGKVLDPGEYTVDAILNGVVVSTYEICLPTFTSSNGTKIGNVNCDNQLPPNNPPATTTATTTPSATNYTGKFTYDPTPTTVSCNTAAGTCTFTKRIKGVTLGDVALYLNMYPVSDFDAGGNKGFSVNGHSYTVKVYPGKTYVATITVPISELVPKMNAMQVANRNYYIEFQDIADMANKSLKRAYDFGNEIPMSAGQMTNATFELVSLMAPATTATIKATIAATGNVSVTSPLDLLIWPNGGAGVPQKVASTDPLVINSDGVSFTISHPGLAANSSYNYRFIVSTTNEVVYENTFLTSTSFDQAVVLVNGACGNATESPQASQPTAEGALCGAGKPGPVSGTGPWTWTCMGEGGGTDAPCEAESLSSAGGATCGSAQGTERDESKPPAAEGELCSKGVAGTVTETTSGWSWKCTVDNASASCSATKKTASGGGDGGGDEITTKSLLQNPFKTLDSFPKIIKAVVNNIVLPIAVPFIAVMLIYSGFLFVVARRNGDVYNIQKAKQTLVYTLIGATLTLGAFVIANAIQGTLNSIVSTRYQSHYETRV